MSSYFKCKEIAWKVFVLFQNYFFLIDLKVRKYKFDTSKFFVFKNIRFHFSLNSNRNKNGNTFESIAMENFWSLTLELGNNPLHGPNDGSFGPRFFPVNNLYNKALRNLAKQCSVQVEQGTQEPGQTVLSSGTTRPSGTWPNSAQFR